jgi:hypothetical protein
MGVSYVYKTQPLSDVLYMKNEGSKLVQMDFKTLRFDNRFTYWLQIVTTVEL